MQMLNTYGHITPNKSFNNGDFIVVITNTYLENHTKNENVI